MKFTLWAYFVGCSDVEYMSADLYSSLLNDWCDLDKTAETVMTKSVFLEVDVEPVKPARGHTHGKSAATRSTASRIIDRASQAIGKKPTFIQGSAADLRQGRTITRNYFWVKDLQVPDIQMSEPPEATAMVDVDYYVNMPRFLTQHFVPHYLYTFVPSRAAKDSGEYSFHFNSEGKVVYNVSGGGQYEHELWDWTGDSVLAVRRFWGIPYRVSTYCLERRMMDDDHQLILLAPLKQFKGIVSSWLATKRLAGKQLERFNPVQNGFVRMYVNSNTGMSVSTGKTGCYGASYTPAGVDDAIASAATTCSQKIQLATVKSKMEWGGCSDHVGAEILLEYHLAGRKPAPVVSLLAAVRRFQWVPEGKTYDQEAKPSMVAFMHPLIDGAFVPDDCENNDIRAVEERVLKVANTDSFITMFVSNCMDEFIHFFFGGRSHFLEPYENDVVYERAKKPSQKRIYDIAQHTSSTRTAKNFVKKEAYETVTDPRIISQINGVDKMSYAGFIYALSDILKEQEWYAFGKSPKEIAERVVEICANAAKVSETDFSKMDGRVDIVLRELERRLMLFGFKPKYHIRLYEVMRKQFCLRAVSKNGVRYDTGYARSSGSFETSDFNSIGNGFTCYMGYRRMRNAFGAYYTPEEAWSKLGIYGGDDGLSADLDQRAAGLSAKSVGQKLTLNDVKRGEYPVSFLARRYGPDVWFGAGDSCCSIVRTLSKFHTTVHLPRNITASDKLRDKAFALWLTDRNTPIIGPFVRKVLELYPMDKDTFRNLAGQWNVETDTDKQYPNDNYACWMESVCLDEIPTFDHATFLQWLENADGTSILHPPVLAEKMEPKPKPGVVVVDGDVIVSECSKTASTSSKCSTTTAQVSRKRRFRPKKPKSERGNNNTNKNAATPAKPRVRRNKRE
jgi:hypothetical protein